VGKLVISKGTFDCDSGEGEAGGEGGVGGT